MDIFEKLQILTDAAKYDVACTSSGSDKGNPNSKIGTTTASGICHSFSSDGRCISLLKILFTNHCEFDCKYCVNRKSNDVKRVAFTPIEIADLTMNFYRRNYIEGLFLSSGVIKNANHTTELLIETLLILRKKYLFNGYIHVKAIPGTDEHLLHQLGLLADRMSANIELPSQKSLALLAPDKSKASVFSPIKFITKTKITTAIEPYKEKFVPAGQSTQMIVGASSESDFDIIKLTEAMYKKYQLKRVFFSAYMPIADNSLLPALDTKPPLLREHRLYQADWLLRFYDFTAEELLDNNNPNFNPFLDPKCNWAINHPEFFPVEINRCSFSVLLRVPGIGHKNAKKIMQSRKHAKLDFADLKKMGISLKRAQFFITCMGKTLEGLKLNQDKILHSILSEKAMYMLNEQNYQQMSLFDDTNFNKEDVLSCLTGQM